MSHVVFWSAESGRVFERVPDRPSAVALVAQLRNERGVTDAEVFALRAVPLSFRTVVVVEAAPDADEVDPHTTDAGPADGYDALLPLGGDVPGVVPDQPVPLLSLAATGMSVPETPPVTGEQPPAMPRLVGLPAVAEEAPSRSADGSDAVGGPGGSPTEAGSEDAGGAPAAARSLGLFA